MAGAICLLGASSGVAQSVPPNYEFQCRTRSTTTNACTNSFDNAFASNVHGVAIGKQSKVWYVQYGGGIIARNPDGSKLELTSDKLTFKQTAGVDDKSWIASIKLGDLPAEATANLRGIGRAHDGNILVVVNHNTLYKLDAITGEPLARWVSPTTLSSPSSTADGRVYIGGVASNNNYIVKESISTPGTYDIVEPDFALPNRSGVSRTASISPDGNTIYVAFENTKVSVNVRQGNTWVSGGDIMHGTTTKATYPLSDGRVFTVSESATGVDAKLRFTDSKFPANSWEANLPDLTSGDLRGLAISPGLDTVIVSSHATGRLFRFILSGPMNYRVADVRGIDINGVETMVDKNVRLKGVVNSSNLSSDDYNFSLIAKNDGAIQVFKADKGAMTYTPALGDSIAVMGKIAQNKGMLRVEVDSIRLISANQPLATPMVVSGLNESVEGQLVTLEDVMLLDPAKWTTGFGADGFTVQVTKGAETYNVFISSNSPLYNMAAPAGITEVTGLVMQSKDDAPFTSGYYLVPRTSADIEFTTPSEPAVVGELLPNFGRDCITINPVTGECDTYFANNAGLIDISSLAIDKKGKLWIAFYKGGIAVQNPDGTPYELTSPNLVTATTPEVDKSIIKQIKFKTFTDNVVDVTAVGRAIDGNILAIVNSKFLYKLDAITGEPMARYEAPITMTGLTTTADGRIYIGGVTNGRSIILKLSAADPTTFTVLEDFMLPNRAGYASRSTAISPSGNAIFYTGENTTMSLNVRNQAGEWEAAGAIAFDNITKVARAIDDKHVLSVSQSGNSKPATLNYNDLEHPENSWKMPLTEVEDVLTTTTDLRAMAFSPKFDTVYVGSFASGNLYRYIKGALAPPAPIVVGEVLPTFRRDCLTMDPVTGECTTFFPADISDAEELQALAVDKQSKLWVAMYNDGIAIRNADGSRAQLTSPNLSFAATPANDQSVITEIRFNGFTDAATNVRSLARAHDGNILAIVGNRTLYKLNAVTGEPMARYRGTNALSWAGLSSSADGQIFVHTVLGSDNTQFILKQSTTDPKTFDLVKDAFPLDGRIGYASRSNSVSPDGKTWLISGESNILNVYDLNENNVWVRSEIMTVGKSSKAYAIDNNRIITLQAFDGEPTTLNLHTRENLTSPWENQWSMVLRGMTAADVDLRGLAFTPRIDTVYVGSWKTGATYRYIAQMPIDYTIAQVRPVDAVGVAEKNGEYVRLNGTVTTANMSMAGFNFIILENGSAIQVLKPTKGGINYTPAIGDNVEVLGMLMQKEGMLSLDVDQIKLISTDGTVAAPQVVTTLTEANEAMSVRLEQVKLVNAAQWTTGQGEGGFMVEVMKGTEKIDVYISSSSPLYNMAAPTGELEIDGIVMQADATSPYTSGYFVMVGAAQNVKFASVSTLADTQFCVGETVQLPIYAMGANGATATVKVELSNALGAFTSPTVIGTYQGIGTGQVTITIPQVINGAGYRIRLMLTDPALTNQLAQTITITNAPVATFTQSGDKLTSSVGDAYQWYLNGTAIAAPAGTDRDYMATEPGNYKVEVKMNDCSNVSAEQAVVVSAIRKDALAQAVKLYPVPTTGQVYLEVPAALRQNTKVQVTDLAGRHVLTATTNSSDALSLDLSGQPAGVYLVILQTSEGKIVRRIIKQQLT